MECIKDSRLIEFDVQNLDKFMLIYPEFGDFHKEIWKDILLVYLKDIESITIIIQRTI